MYTVRNRMMPPGTRLGLDTCCGGTITLGEAARSAGLTSNELRAELGPALETQR